MNLTLSEEQLALQETLNRFVAKDYSFKTRHDIIGSATGISASHWAQFAELGLLALPFAETYGGLGGSAVDTMLVMEAMGRGLMVEPYLATVVLAGGLLRDAGSEAQKELWLPQIADGSLLMGFAHYETGGRYEIDRVATRAQRTGGGYVLNGTKTFVLHGAQANQLIVSALDVHDAQPAGTLSLFMVDPNAEGVNIHDYVTQDNLRAAEITFTDVKLDDHALLGEDHAVAALPTIERVLDAANAALCAEAVGAMDALNQATLEYLKTRKQFGVPIGSFQALQHRMVDMFTAAEQARSMAILASIRMQSANAAERRWACAAAKVLVSESARLVGQQAVQLHGGMGVTDELNISHYFKRLTAICATFGDADYHLGYVSDSLLAA